MPIVILFPLNHVIVYTFMILQATTAQTQTYTNSFARASPDWNAGV